RTQSVYRAFMAPESALAAKCDMGLAPGGRMKQEIYKDAYDFEDWDVSRSSRCFVHIANWLSWQALTKQQPPQLPPTAAEYTRHGLPWFDYYDDSLQANEGSGVLANLKSVADLGKEKRVPPLLENESCAPDNVVKLPKKRVGNQVREGTF